MFGCHGSTGGARIHFRVAAAGPALDPATIREFVNRLGFDVVVSSAVLHIGAIYLNANANISTASDQFGCYGGGLYVGQVLGGLDVDLLSPELQYFGVLGEGEESPVRAAAVWLTGQKMADVVDDSQVILSIAGVARRANQSYPFNGALTIGRSHLVPPSSPATPGINPICKQRIIAPIGVGFQLSDGGLLVVRVDPYDLFAGTDFSTLPPVPNSNPPSYRFSDRINNLADADVFAQLTSDTTYAVSWQAQ
jgi:hypothetical protein